MYDITIIGLGPAGSTFARIIDKKYNVLCIDKKNDTDTSFKKPCGGLLAPDATKELSKFNISLPKDILVDPQIFFVKTIDLNSNIIRRYQRLYMNMDRHKFDMWLISLIPPNITLQMNSSCKKIKKENGFYEITYNCNGEDKTIKTRYIVGADGANSFVRRTMFPEHKIKTYLSIQQWFVDNNKEPLYACMFDKRLTDSYCWGLSKDDKFILGGAFPVKLAKNNFEKLKKQLENYGFDFSKPLNTEACLVLKPEKLSDFCTGANNIFLIGEAAGFISPSSLEGFSYAFRSANCLKKSFESNLKNKQYNKNSYIIKIKLMSKILKRPFMYNAKIRKLVMKSKLTSLD